MIDPTTWNRNAVIERLRKRLEECRKSLALMEQAYELLTQEEEEESVPSD